MSLTPGGPGGEYEVVVRDDPGSLLAARLRAVAHTGRVRLAQLRRWLRTPQGRRTALRIGRGVALVGAGLGAWVMLRRWVGAARGVLAAVATGYRSAAGAVGAAADGARFVLSLGWLSRLLRWWSLASRRGTAGHVHCRDCHARVRADARVCYRCGHRAPAGAEVGLGGVAGGGPARGALVGTAIWLWRVLLLRLYRRCPDCRRLVHADARVCRSCGYRLPG